ncbi:MAG TPA: aldehyde dehydrogenase family protein, partial [Bryobacteraceae bacterium]|nr:aldehyde dehydrogenase family protein [Bryobacteraceae bacterium]
MSIQSINPATGELLATFDPLSPEAVEGRLQSSSAAFALWKRTSFSERARLLCRAAEILEAESERLGRLMTAEMGKPVRPAIDEVRKSATGCRFYADNAARFLSDTDIATSAKRSYVRYEPMGAVLAIMPWNFPFWQVFRFAAPALMAGNVGLLKHAPNVPQCALAIEKIFLDAGFPQGVFQTLLLETD